MKNKKLTIFTMAMALSLCCMGGLYIVSNADFTDPDVTLTMNIQDISQPQYILYTYSNIDNVSVVIDDGTTLLTKRNSYTMHQFSSVGIHKVRLYANGKTPIFYITNNVCVTKFIQHKVGLKFKFKECPNLTTAIIKSKVGEFAVPVSDWFSSCTSLTTISMPTLREMPTKQPYPFTNCTSLVSVDLPMLTNIYNYAFCNCTSLKTFSATNVLHVGGRVFQYCAQLENVNLPNLETLGFNAFYQCPSLTALSLPNVTTIGT